jgi:phage terminase large subunit GpA-like protein
LGATIAKAVKNFAPPDRLTVTEWANKHRVLSPENSAESGRWRTSRTPYLAEPMNAFTDPRVNMIVMVASSQVGKSECMNNMIGYVMDNDPGPAMFIMPTIENVTEYSLRRLAPMIRDTKVLREKVREAKSRDSSNTIRRKSYPGGTLSMAGSNSASSLASTPSQYIFGDELDRWAVSAGSEGDPWELAKARTSTFYNKKLVAFSTPTVKGASKIAALYAEGTMETWQHKCPECRAYHQIVFGDVKFTNERIAADGELDYVVSDIYYLCPECGCVITEDAIKSQPAKWVAAHPGAIAHGTRSFWMNGFSSPWLAWGEIIRAFLRSSNDPAKLQVVYNTMFGQLWEQRGDIVEEDSLLARREEYAADLPDGVLVLTCGVDTQDDRLEYEVVGHGLYGETWGIKRGVLIGKPDFGAAVWDDLDEVIDRTYYFNGGKKGLIVSLTFVDSGGHFTQEVYYECAKRMNKRMFAIKGKGGDGVPYVSPKPTRVDIRRQMKKVGQAWLYIVGVDAGKAKIMSSLKVMEAGPKYCHFPIGDGAGYEHTYFVGLLSERMQRSRSGGRDVWKWEKIPGHERNEQLDARNYALAAFALLSPSMDKELRKVKGIDKPAEQKQKRTTAAPKRKRNSYLDGGDW